MNKLKKLIVVPFRPFPLLTFLLLLLAALCLYRHDTTRYSIFSRTWGFDHILYYGTSVKLGFALICLLLVFPSSNRGLQVLLTRLLSVLNKLISNKLLLFLLFACLGIFIFYKLNVKYYFLGDLNLRLLQTMRKEFLTTEFLSMKLLYYFTTTGTYMGFNQESVFKFYSCLAGGIYIYLILLISDLQGKNQLQKILLAAIQLSSALILVFCGYAEVYATPFVLITLYIYLGLRYLKNHSGFLIVTIVLALAIFSHLICSVAIPSLLLLLYFRHRDKLGKIQKLNNYVIGLLVIIVILGGTLLAYYFGETYLLPLYKSYERNAYLSVFSYKHLWELFNALVLCCSLTIFLLFFYLVKSLINNIKLEAELYFLLSIAAGSLLFTTVANLQRGSGDWDIVAFTALSINLVTALLSFKIFERQPALSNYSVTALAGLAGINTILWLYIHHTDLSIQKVTNMMHKDPASYYTARISGDLQMMLSLKNNKLYKEAEDLALKLCNAGGLDSERACVMYGERLRDSDRLDEACLFFEDLLLNRNRYVYEGYLFLLEYYEKNNNNQKILFYLNRMFDSFSANPDKFLNNANFRFPVLIGLFQLLQQYDAANSTPERRTEVKNMIDELIRFSEANKQLHGSKP